jgi:hypothetical protein
LWRFIVSVKRTKKSETVSSVIDPVTARLAETVFRSGLAMPEKLQPPGFEDEPGWINGWLISIRTSEVFPAWSECSAHGLGRHRSGPRWKKGSPDENVTASQNSIAVFGTRLDALTALRLEAENEALRKLAVIDLQIEAEREATTEPLPGLK